MKCEYEQKEEKKNKNQKWWGNRKNRIYEDANTQTHADIAWIEKKTVQCPSIKFELC